MKLRSDCLSVRSGGPWEMARLGRGCATIPNRNNWFLVQSAYLLVAPRLRDLNYPGHSHLGSGRAWNVMGLLTMTGVIQLGKDDT